ncbi:MAG TPA: hypothetical protein VF701_02120 [Thermoanaerobaculia bacterium]
MRREDLIAFARRDWTSVATEKDRFWVEQKRQMTATEALQFADDLRSSVVRRRGDWPSADERRVDLETHARVSESLRRARAR